MLASFSHLFFASSVLIRFSHFLPRLFLLYYGLPRFSRSLRSCLPPLPLLTLFLSFPPCMHPSLSALLSLSPSLSLRVPVASRLSSWLPASPSLHLCLCLPVLPARLHLDTRAPPAGLTLSPSRAPRHLTPSAPRVFTRGRSGRGVSVARVPLPSQGRNRPLRFPGPTLRWARARKEGRERAVGRECWGLQGGIWRPSPE